MADTKSRSTAFPCEVVLMLNSRAPWGEHLTISCFDGKIERIHRGIDVRSRYPIFLDIGELDNGGVSIFLERKDLILMITNDDITAYPGRMRRRYAVEVISTDAETVYTHEGEDIACRYSRVNHTVPAYNKSVPPQPFDLPEGFKFRDNRAPPTRGRGRGGRGRGSLSRSDSRSGSSTVSDAVSPVTSPAPSQIARAEKTAKTKTPNLQNNGLSTTEMGDLGKQGNGKGKKNKSRKTGKENNQVTTRVEDSTIDQKILDKSKQLIPEQVDLDASSDDDLEQTKQTSAPANDAESDLQEYEDQLFEMYHARMIDFVGSFQVDKAEDKQLYKWCSKLMVPVREVCERKRVHALKIADIHAYDARIVVDKNTGEEVYALTDAGTSDAATEVWKLAGSRSRVVICVRAVEALPTTVAGI